VAVSIKKVVLAVIALTALAGVLPASAQAASTSMAGQRVALSVVAMSLTGAIPHRQMMSYVVAPDGRLIWPNRGQPC
jgi:hypothetical protein